MINLINTTECSLVTVALDLLPV